MAKYAIDSTTLTGIADAIREKTKTTASVQTSKMAEAILAINGGASVDVVTASSLPAAVVDGQIVVITDTTPGAVYIDTDEPASPATGDVWVKLEAEATVKLELSEESPYLRAGLTKAVRWAETAWIACDGYIGIEGSWKQFSSSVKALNDYTWEQIATIAASGQAAEYFSIGDAKQITINGEVGHTSFNNLKVWAFIIGFDHNASKEGANTIHFQICKDAQVDGKNICLVDSMYAATSTDAGNFVMNTTNANSGGWKNSKMRKTLLGNDGIPSSPLANSLMAALPSDLRAVMKGVTKYTDNTGNGKDTASYVTATTDYLWLLSEFEVTGQKQYANSAERNYQKQYDYYASGNSVLFYRHTSDLNVGLWWTRSVDAGGTTFFVIVTGSGVTYQNTYYSFALAPAFCV